VYSSAAFFCRCATSLGRGSFQACNQVSSQEEARPIQGEREAASFSVLHIPINACQALYNPLHCPPMELRAMAATCHFLKLSQLPACELPVSRAFSHNPSWEGTTQKQQLLSSRAPKGLALRRLGVSLPAPRIKGTSEGMKPARAWLVCEQPSTGQGKGKGMRRRGRGGQGVSQRRRDGGGRGPRRRSFCVR